jgi:LPS-assembly lipoprotein
MADALRAALRFSVEVVADPRQADVVVVALNEQRLRSIVATGAAGQVRELQLRLQFSYKVQSARGQELLLPVEMVLSRDMSYAEAFALAKAAEEEQLVREMQEDMALQVLRRLATLKP